MSQARENLTKVSNAKAKSFRGHTGAPGAMVPAKKSNKKIPKNIQRIIDQYGIKISSPSRFAGLSQSKQLDYLSTRIIAQSRTTTSINEMKESGILSVSQYERRVAKEVYSNYGTLNHIMSDELKSGVFGRKYVNRK